MIITVFIILISRLVGVHQLNTIGKIYSPILNAHLTQDIIGEDWRFFQPDLNEKHFVISGSHIEYLIDQYPYLHKWLYTAE